RLRDIGGIIVIDFIDMANPKNRQLVEDALNTELGRDRTKTYVVEISPLGLVEMTRQNVTDGPREILTVKCATCDATGVVVSAETHAVEAERQLRKAVRSSRAEAFQVELHSDVAAILVGPDGSRLAELEKELGRRFAFKTKKSFRLDRFEILASGKAAQIVGEEPAPAADRPAPSRARKTTRAPKAPVGIEDALAEVPEADAPSADGDEAAAEKPKKRTRRGTRGGRGRKRKTTVAAGNGSAPEGAEPAVSAEPEAETPVPAEATAGGADADGKPLAEEKPRKKTRRGSRGGRRRKKKTTPESADGGAIATVEEAG
ncbi:MAG TPA: ribonuclease E/G, partial [Gaiellaceae bacterium]|nr:ribonuclease E/G [Gaiellaceae bacterium]